MLNNFKEKFESSFNSMMNTKTDYLLIFSYSVNVYSIMTTYNMSSQANLEGGEKTLKRFILLY